MVSHKVKPRIAMFEAIVLALVITGTIGEVKPAHAGGASIEHIQLPVVSVSFIHETDHTLALTMGRLQ